METEYVKALEAIRYARGLRWEGMAIILRYSENRLLKIVKGKRDIPPGMTAQVIKRFRLTKQEVEALKKAEEAEEQKQLTKKARGNRKSTM